jgi:selenocysteine lyase/cysteine desulfurase
LAKTAGSGRRIIGSFSAASNVTGVRTDVHAIARILHRHGAIACFDFAALAPYVPIDMHPKDDPAAALDAIFISPHKMLGGPGTPGVLAFRRDLYSLEVPTTVGGGTVVYVSPLGHVYTDNIEQREEAGTPGILQKIRCGLAFALKDHVGGDVIEAREQRFLDMCLERFAAQPQVELLGPATRARVPIVSFNIALATASGMPKRYLHHRFVTTLLSDMFGIQSRAGCSCAGPYGHRLLGIGDDQSERYRCVIVKGFEGLKPGWVRIGFHWAMDDAECSFLLDAVAFIAKYGDRFRRLYDFDLHTGCWRHRAAPPRNEPLLCLEQALCGALPPRQESEPKAAYARYLAEATHLAESLGDAPGYSVAPPDLAPDMAELVFFAW